MSWITRSTRLKLVVFLLIAIVFLCIAISAIINPWSSEAKATNQALYRELFATGTADIATRTAAAKLGVTPPHD